jgi:hypothetical protein
LSVNRKKHRNNLHTSVTHSFSQRMEEILLPPNSIRRYYYELWRSGIRVISREGWWVFMKKSRPYFLHEFKNFKETLICQLPRLSGLNKEKREQPIIVSMTSYPARIKAAVIVLGRMLRQTCKPDKILLYLVKEQFHDKKIPIGLRLLNKCGIEIIYCNELHPHNKYFYTMQKYPEAITITVDDDNYYEKNFIGCLYRSYKKHPKAVSARRTHIITFEKSSRMKPNFKWGINYSEIIDQPSMRLFALGVGGVLYPPHCMHSELFNEEKLKNLCLTDDDVWLKIMQVMNNTPVVQIAEYQDEYPIWGTQQTALWFINEKAIDKHLQNTLKVYNEYFGKEDTLIKRLKESI